MSILKFQGPAAFTQSVRMRRTAAPKNTLFLIVEGASDKKTFHPLVNPSVHFVPSRGKDMVLSAFATLTAEGVSDCLFIVDCDGGTDSKWLGRDGLIVSTNRDVDADLLLCLSAFDAIALEYLSGHGATARECIALGSDLLTYALQLTANFGAILDRARDAGATVKIFDSKFGSRRRLQMRDLEAFESWIENFISPEPEELLDAMRRALSWDTPVVTTIGEMVGDSKTKRCRLHSASECQLCAPRRYSGGHDLVDVLAAALTQRCGFEVTAAEFARATRLATRATAVEAWEVAVRINKWLDERVVA
jgi:hypothetical protein